ncbi:MAG: DoxX family protein [Vampirovibrionales bacterium]|nr:DoxX family protein [Vampirovibrionales bacterium]
MKLAVLLKSTGNKQIVLIRLMVGAVFVCEGIQKVLFPEVLGVGRFAEIGFPNPEFLGYFVSVFEVICGVLVLLGFLTRLASIPLIVIMLVAIASTKVPVFFSEGFWKMAHEARTDWSMLLGALFLLMVGAGSWSLDAYLSRMIDKRRIK